MRRCYKCGAKKQDDLILCEKCEKELKERMEKQMQEPCDDAISREELLKAIETWDKFGCDANTRLVRYQDHYIPYIHYDNVIKCIKGMPPVTQKPIECDDAVSRILKRMWNCRGKHTTSIDKVAMEQIIRDELPSVTQKSETETWNGMHGQITAPKGTFKKIYEDAESEDLGDYPDTIHNQFDNMTGSMNL